MEELLPTKARTTSVDPRGLVYLAIAVPKWGKTTFFCDVPGALLIAFERGFQFQNIPTVFVDVWHQKDFTPYKDSQGVVHMTMTQLKESLVASDKYQFLIFDTADMAAKKCSDYYLQKHKAAHPQDLGDYGRGYDLVQNTPFRQMIGELMATGRGMAFTTHQQINTTEFKKGKKSMKETTLPGGVYKFLHTQADIILHGHFGVREEGNTFRNRIWQTSGDEETLAGNRSRHSKLPEKYIVDPDRPWAQWCEFFTDPKKAAEAETALESASFRRKREADEEEDDAPPKKKLKKLSSARK